MSHDPPSGGRGAACTPGARSARGRHGAAGTGPLRSARGFGQDDDLGGTHLLARRKWCVRAPDHRRDLQQARCRRARRATGRRTRAAWSGERHAASAHLPRTRPRDPGRCRRRTCATWSIVWTSSDASTGSIHSAAALRRLDDAFSGLKLDLMIDADELRRMVAAGQELPVEPDMASAFVAYEDWLARNESLDFDDLVRRALARLRSRRGTAREVAGRAARTLLVDEVQDVDRSQLELALALTGERRDIFLVGDDDQTIYAWRLADVRRVLDLAASLPGLRRVDLVTNYRCPRAVVERAVRLGRTQSRTLRKSDSRQPVCQRPAHPGARSG